MPYEHFVFSCHQLITTTTSSPKHRPGKKGYTSSRPHTQPHLRQKAAQITEGSVFCTASISSSPVSFLEPFPPLHLPHQKGLENENFRLFHTPTEPHTDFKEPHLNEIEFAFLLNLFRKNISIKSKRVRREQPLAFLSLLMGDFTSSHPRKLIQHLYLHLCTPESKTPILLA